MEKVIVVLLSGNNLKCDCFLRPLSRYFQSQLVLKPFYKTITCRSPQYLANRTLYTLGEERLNCPRNVIIDKYKESQPEEYGILTDLKFRELNQ